MATSFESRSCISLPAPSLLSVVEVSLINDTLEVVGFSKVGRRFC